MKRKNLSWFLFCSYYLQLSDWVGADDRNNLSMQIVLDTIATKLEGLEDKLDGLGDNPNSQNSENDEVIRAYLERITHLFNQRQEKFDRPINEKFAQISEQAASFEETLHNMETKIDGITSLIQTQQRNFSNVNEWRNEVETFTQLDAKLTQIISLATHLEESCKKNVVNGTLGGIGVTFSSTAIPPGTTTSTQRASCITSRGQEPECHSVNSWVEYGGTNIILQIPKIDLGDCCALCKKKYGCKAFTWSKGAICWLHADLRSKPVLSFDYISGLAENPNDSNSTEWVGNDCLAVTSGFDLSPGSHDIGIIRNMNLAWCCLKCNSEPSCRAYVWDIETRICWLKDVDAPRIASAGRVSGLQNRQSPK